MNISPSTMRYKTRLSLCGLVLVCGSACSGGALSISGLAASGLPATDSGQIQLIVSERHRSDFAVFAGHADAIIRDEDEIDSIFRKLTADGNRYCEAIFGRSKVTEQALALLRKNVRADYVAHRHADSLHSLLAGCRNFYEMNDFRPDRDFRLVRELYPGAEFDCYAVGLLQPYLMHSSLGCRQLTMIDIDWRILAVHRQLLRFARARELADPPAVDRKLAGMSLAYPALHDRPPPARPGALRYLCRTVQHDFCRDILPDFQAAFHAAPPAAIRLNLSALHSGAYAQRSSASAASIRVIYLSNAIEESYTSRAQFQELLENLQTSAGDSPGVDLLIHHVGGWKLFGVYELRHGGPHSAPLTRLKTICKDRYLSLSRSDTQDAVEYATHFEDASSNGRSPALPSCGALLKN